MNTLLHETLAEQTAVPEYLTDPYISAIASAKNASDKAIKIQNILVPINSLKSSRAALRNARWFAEQSGAKITILYAAAPRSSTPSPRELQEEITESVGIKPTQLRAMLVRTDVTGYLPIRDAARDETADLIIIPADFQWGPNHFWSADPLEGLIRHAPCPLLIVNDKQFQPVSHNGSRQVHEN